MIPRYPLRTLPCDRICETTCRAVLEGTAKPIPCAAGMIAVLIPTTRPLESTSGPPEFPGFNGAVCWITFSISRWSRLRMPRPVALTTPVETLDWNPSGLPMAITSCPTLSAEESPRDA